MYFEVNIALTKSSLSPLLNSLPHRLFLRFILLIFYKHFFCITAGSHRAQCCSPLLILSHPGAALWPVHSFYVFSQHALYKDDGLGLKQLRAASPAGVGWSFKCSVSDTFFTPHPRNYLKSQLSVSVLNCQERHWIQKVGGAYGAIKYSEKKIKALPFFRNTNHLGGCKT